MVHVQAASQRCGGSVNLELIGRLTHTPELPGIQLRRSQLNTTGQPSAYRQPQATPIYTYM